MVLTLIKKIRHSMIILTVYRYETAAVDHSWLSSGTAIWSLGMQAVCAIGQFPAIQKRKIYCSAIKTSMFRNQGFFYHTRWILRFTYFSIHKGLKCQHLVRQKILWIWSSVPPLSPSKRSTDNEVARWTLAWCVYTERPDVQRSV